MINRNKAKDEILNKELKLQMHELLAGHRMVFGNPDDIQIKAYCDKLQRHRGRVDEKNSMMTQVIYLLKKNVGKNSPAKT
jgi:hypothetical protein